VFLRGAGLVDFPAGSGSVLGPSVAVWAQFFGRDARIKKSIRWRKGAIVKHVVFVGVVAAIAAVSGSAFAADMAMKAPPPAYPAYDWGGLYVGGVLGGAWGTIDTSDPGLGVLGTAVSTPVTQTTSSSGFIGGVEGGSNYQMGKLVIGWEADITWGGLNGTSTSSFGPPLLPSGVLNRTITADTNWTATTTSRLGIAHDRWLIYGKAGVAYAHTNYTDNWTTTGGLPALHRRQQREPGRLDGGRGYRMGDLEHLVDQGRI
jgi:opacity protein-like surface antigen